LAFRLTRKLDSLDTKAKVIKRSSRDLCGYANHEWVFRPIVTGRFGIVTERFGNVTADFGGT